MDSVGVIDRFLAVFTSYIDSGFGLLGGDVAFLASTLIVIDVTLAALVWAWGADEDILARLVKKTLFVGVFAYIIGNWNALARIVFDSFAGLGTLASGGSVSASELLQPGRIASVGLEAGEPILASIADLVGFVSFFENFLQIAILLFAWIVVLLSFFILAIQLFVTLIEFKLATLAGFILVPFGLFGKTAFMAERVLGLVVSSGVKVLVLAVIVGIGSTIFGEFTTGFSAEPTIEDAMAIVLASLSLLALGIFGPGIANGIVSGGPQLGAGAAIGAGLAAGGAIAGGAAAARAVAGTSANVARAGAVMAGGTHAGWQTGQRTHGGVSGGASGVAMAAGSAATAPLRSAAGGLRQSFNDGSHFATAAVEGAGPEGGDRASAVNATPDWAKRMQRSGRMNRGIATVAQAVRAGDGSAGGTSVKLTEDR